MREIIPASAGAEADVPPSCSTLPPTTTTKLCPAAEISGKPLRRQTVVGSIVQSVCSGGTRARWLAVCAAGCCPRMEHTNLQSTWEGVGGGSWVGSVRAMRRASYWKQKSSHANAPERGV